MNKDGKAANAGGTYYIVEGDQVPFDDSKFKAGDEVASYFVYPLTGDRARHQRRDALGQRRATRPWSAASS